MNWGWGIQTKLQAKSDKRKNLWQVVNPHQVVLVCNVEKVWTGLAKKDLHIAPLETTDTNKGGRPRGLSAVCFNSTFLTLLVGENEAFWGSSSPSASGPEGLSRGPVDAQKRDWHDSCAVVGHEALNIFMKIWNTKKVLVAVLAGLADS